MPDKVYTSINLSPSTAVDRKCKSSDVMVIEFIATISNIIPVDPVFAPNVLNKDLWTVLKSSVGVGPGDGGAVSGMVSPGKITVNLMFPSGSS